MVRWKKFNLVLAVIVIVSMLMGATGASFAAVPDPGPSGSTFAREVAPEEQLVPAALPASPTDETQVAHYFGPNPNWANSPFTLPDVTVEIIGDGSGATATATVGANGAVTGITLVDPGSGYTAATVSITGAGTGATATATVAASGAVTAVTVDAAGSGYTAPTVSFTGGGGAGTLVQVGNALVARTYATDYATAPGVLGPLLVVLPVTMPANGVVKSIEYFNQATTGASPTPSAGNLFHAYVLGATGNPNEYAVLWDSGEQVVPVAVDPVGDVVSITVPDIAVTTGDVIAIYGEGIPVDDLGTGTDILSYPANTPPGGIITLGGVDFPIYSQTRTYSLAATVLDASGVAPLMPAAATAYGGVDAIAVVSGGAGYTNPTVEFDMPDGPDGVIASGHAVLDASGAVTAIVVDNPGSGYSTAPNVMVYNGTLYEPIACQLAAAKAMRQEMIESQDQGRLAPEQSSPAPRLDSAEMTSESGLVLATAETISIFASAADCGAVAAATLAISSIVVDAPGDGYVSAPTVTISDPTGSGAAATATVSAGAITSIALTAPGTGYVTPGGIKKFTDPLPGLCDPAVPGSCPTDGSKFLPLAVAEKIKYDGIEADQYEIALVQYRTSFSSSLPGTLARGYVQLETPANAGISQHFPLQNELLDGTLVDTGYFGVTSPQWLGPIIVATKDKPARIIFRNLLPADPDSMDGVSDGDLFLPTDSTLMGSGMADTPDFDYQDLGTVTDEARNPECTEYPKSGMCYKDNRATLHLHGGISPWISDGTPHQWITPATEDTNWPQGVSVSNVPDMAGAGCDAADDGCMTFYYTNQQSARLMFYHDHAWGITRLNVYAGEAAGYLITDDTEQTLLNSNTIPAEQIPLIIQDRTFVPQDTQMYNQYDAEGNVVSYGQDPTWDASRWGGYGNFWYHHTYMPAQNPGDPGGMSAFGRWMYGPWFWPPASDTKFGPIANPYFGKDPKGPDGMRGTADDWTADLAVPCNLDDPATWQYDTDPFCEPAQIPGTPNISTGMEQFNDTPTVNGVAYPTITLEPKSYRFRILSVANDRFFNFQWYVGDPATASTGTNTQGQVIGPTEVALNPAELAAAQTDPNVFPTPVQGLATAGPDWIQIGTEGGFLPAPVVVDGQQPTTWIIDPTRFDVGNVDQHSLLLAPAERADVIVDFSQFAGKTLILYNDAPAAFPARVASYDYYTGTPDLSPVGAPVILPGYGPNTRTIMQVKIAGAPAPAFNVNRLNNAFRHKANGTGVFESGQHPIIVGQAAYNSAYGTSFAAGSNCNVPVNSLTTTTQRCDGLVRVNDTSLFGFNTLTAPMSRMVMGLEPKAIHDEMNSTSFDEFGRMQAFLGIEAQPPTPGTQNVTLYPYVNPQTELIDATNLPKNDVIYDELTGLPVSDVQITPIADAADGSQIWRMTHNGVDTHPIHFHLYDVQVLNRVTWDNIIIPPDPTELGWKDTVRTSPLEDTIVALRPIIPELPFEVPNAIRNLSPMMAPGSTQFFNNIDPQGNPTTAIVNQLVNFGWEYVFHCHILSHEEMDMMRPVSVAVPPLVADGLAFDRPTRTLSWNDNSITETSFVVQRSSDDGVTWLDVGTSPSPLDQPNTHGTRSLVDATFDPTITNLYRVAAKNMIGYGAEFPSLTVQSVSDVLTVVAIGIPPAAPSNLIGGAQLNSVANIAQALLQWVDNSTNETGFEVERCTTTSYTNLTCVTPYALIATTPAHPGVSTLGVPSSYAHYVDMTVVPGTGYRYRARAVIGALASDYSNNYGVGIRPAPAAPTNVAVALVGGSPRQVLVTWTDNATTESQYRVQRATNAAFTQNRTTVNLGANSVSYQTPNLLANRQWYFRVEALNLHSPSGWVVATPSPIVTGP